MDSRQVRAFRRQVRRFLRRGIPAAISIVLCLSITAQQAQAVQILTTTELPKLPRVGPTAGEMLGEFGRMLLRAITNLLPRIGPAFDGGEPAPRVADPTGRPNPWQVADLAGPFSVVNVANGTLFTTVPLFSWAGVSFNLYHSPGSPTPSTIGYCWSHSFSDHLLLGGSHYAYDTDDGRRIVFDTNGENPIHRLKLEHDTQADTWTVTRADQSKLVFHSAGVLTAVADPNGISTELEYDSGVLKRINAPNGTQLALSYEDEKLITITPPVLKRYAGGGDFDDVARVWSLEYTRRGQLIHVVSPRVAPGTNERHFKTQFEYSSLVFLSHVTDFRDLEGDPGPEAFTTIYAYDEVDRVCTVTHPPVYDYVEEDVLSATRSYSYAEGSEPGATQTTVTDERGGHWGFEFSAGGRLHLVQDPLNRVTATLTWNGSNRPCTITNVLGGTTTIVYDSNGNPDSITTPRGTIDVNFDALNNLTSVKDPVNAVPVQYEYNDAANPTRVTRINGPGASDDAAFEWGDGANGTPAGLVGQMTDPNDVVQQIKYDQYRNVKTTLFGKFSSQESGTCPFHPDHGYLSNRTGEPGASTQGTTCHDQQVCDPCSNNYDGGGNVTDFGVPPGCILSMEQGDGFAPPESSSCDVQPIQYDGNNRLVHAFAYENSPELNLNYDARGREMFYETLSSAWSPGTFTRTREFADGLGRMRTHEEHRPGWAPAAAQVVETELRTDAAGRLTDVLRTTGGSAALHYEYHDTVYSSGTPAIKETREGVGRTDYYLDSDGAVHEIAHWRTTSQDTTLLARYTYTRDANGRITHVDEVRYNPGANPPTYLTAGTTYEYGSGALTSADLDADSSQAIEPGKLQYSWLNTQFQQAMSPGDPNRLVKERRVGDEGMASYQKEYWYDPGGNRLALRESIPNAQGGQTATAVTRYNYWFDVLPNTQWGSTRPPLTPDSSALYQVGGLMHPPGQQEEEYVIWTTGTDYEGRGQNKLLSKQVLHPSAAAQVEGTVYSYDGLSPNNTNRLALTGKVSSVWGWNGAQWQRWGYTNDSYGYDRHDRLSSASVYKVDDHVGPDQPEGSFSEVYHYDLFGRRSVKTHQRFDLQEPPLDGELGYSYDGLSENVLGRMAHRWMKDTFTFGAFGPAIRTDCHGTGGDTLVDQDYYYLYDAMGGTVGMMVPGSGTQRESWQAVFEVFDAFGNRIAPNPVGVTEAAEYCWRGAEGSETDIGRADPENYPDLAPLSDEGTGLVYMQARYYDPDVGRFTQADALPIASGTSQGLNRYVYSENDPVNRTDPTGLNPLAVLGIAGILLFMAGVAVGLWAASGGLTASILSNVLTAILGLLPASLIPCSLRAALMGASTVGALAGAFFAILGALSFATFSSPLVAAAAFALLAFGLGFALGYAIGSLVDASMHRDDVGQDPTTDTRVCATIRPRAWFGWHGAKA